MNTQTDPLSWARDASAETAAASTLAIWLAGEIPGLQTRQWLDSRFAKVVMVPDTADLLRGIAELERAAQQIVVVLELRAMGGIGKAFDVLRGIRETSPEIAVVLISDQSRYHEFDRHRLPICDVTLTADFDEDDLELALLAAKSNNRAWNRRRAELAAPSAA